MDRHALSPSGGAKGVGCDCLGLVRGVWRAVYGADPEHPPAYSRELGRDAARGTAQRYRPRIAGAPSIYDRAYLQSAIEDGEFFNWFYASDTARTNRTRSTISDGVYGKP